ncbi:hypothetical protein SJA_C1-31570 [Sphingobium indicum UT26S]|uniref:Uncharacterized protein n=1 Tax=Sphingobium indicum (strain DSM 16413 / CCM 7287 / MTCC 6362 / UT26 / NBRC 101211 / UT26S) TaxID=452662 RepID=D4Z5V9_SPHIU|nr:hypothetical protein SJA_C1-31570 [Sphingobium indicum UT26S]
MNREAACPLPTLFSHSQRSRALCKFFIATAGGRGVTMRHPQYTDTPPVSGNTEIRVCPPLYGPPACLDKFVRLNGGLTSWLPLA